MARDTLALEAMAGTVLEDKYRLVRILGSGAMAHVYEAEQLRLGRSVAVKMLRVALLSDRRSLERFRTEALAASRINHPNAIAIYDVGITHDGIPFMVMEHLRGTTLAQALATHRFSIERIVTVGAQVLSALEEAHLCGVIHRDLKSENVVLEARRDGTDFIKVVDFGIAAFVGSGDQSIVGTPEYMAPEQIRGEPPLRATDLYAMGIMLYEMIVGRTPFAGVTLTSLLERHLSEEPQPPDELVPCPEALSALVIKALAKDPADRFEDAREMREALLAVVAGSRRACKSCGARVLTGMRFCSACGVDLGELPGQTPTPPMGVPRSTMAFGSGPVETPAAMFEQPRPTRLTFDFSGDDSGHLTGRDAELLRIGDWLGSTGLPPTLGIIGPEGIGKARLVLDAMRARSGQNVTFVAAPDPSGHRLSWYPILSTIETVLGLPPRPTYDDLTAALVRVGLPNRDAPGLAELFAVSGPLAPLELAARRRETFAAAVRTLLAVEHRFPAPVLCFVDIDRYDQPSRKVVEQLATAAVGTRVRVMVTAVSRDHVPLSATVLELGGLAPADAHTYLGRLIGLERALAVSVADLSAMTAGVPAHIQQLAGWLILDTDPTQAPPRIVDLVASRLGHLPATARRLLQAIAAHGQVLPRAWLGPVLEEIDPSGKAMGSLARAGLVVAGDEELTIPLALVAQVAEACTPADTRRALAASILEARGDRLPLVIAAHYAEVAEQLELAMDTFVAAGDEAVRRFDDPRSASLYHRAITIARRLQAEGDARSATELVTISIRLADVLRHMGELALASGSLDEAELFAPTPAQQAGILRARGRIALLQGNHGAAAAQLRRAIGLAFRIGDTEFLCETYIDLATALASTGDVTDAIAELSEAVDALTFGEGMARAERPRRLWLLGLRLADLHWKAGNLVTAKSVARDALAQAERTHSPVGQGRMHTLLAGIFEEAGDTHGALSHQARALDHMRRLGDRRTTAELLLACARITGDVTPSVASGQRRSRDTARKAVDIANELAAEIGWDGKNPVE